MSCSRTPHPRYVDEEMTFLIHKVLHPSLSLRGNDCSVDMSSGTSN